MAVGVILGRSVAGCPGVISNLHITLGLGDAVLEKKTSSHFAPEVDEPVPRKKKSKTFFTPGGGSWLIEVPKRDENIVRVRQYDKDGRERRSPSIIPCPPLYVARKKEPWYVLSWRAVARWLEMVFGG